jgi:acetylornithine deacetylase
MSETIDLLQQLVSIPSINPRGKEVPAEAKMAEAVAAWLRARGISAEIDPVLPGRPNVLARVPGRDRSRTLLLESHLDTVEVDGMTIDPFGGAVRDGNLHGRGACDDKGSLTAMMLALARLAQGPPPPLDVALVGAMDEEHQFRGVAHLVARDRNFVAAIVGEPTELDLITAHKGVLRFTVTTRGRACHSSTPWEGENAIYRMTEVLDCVRRKLEPAAMAKSHPAVGAATWCASIIHGGVAVNTVPEACVIHLDRRTLPGEEPADAYAEAKTALEALGPAWVVVGEPYLVDHALETDPRSPIVQTLGGAVRRAGFPGAIRGVNYGTDASKTARAGIPSVVFGPGSIRQAHSADEFIELRQVEAAVSILVDAIQHFQ